jgi:hypothetical protein
MKSSTFVPFLCLGLFNVTLGYNFWLIDSFTPAIYGGDELLSVSQNGNVPGCVEFDAARSAGGYPPGISFSSVACGVPLNFLLWSKRKHLCLL